MLLLQFFSGDFFKNGRGSLCQTTKMFLIFEVKSDISANFSRELMCWVVEQFVCLLIMDIGVISVRDPKIHKTNRIRPRCREISSFFMKRFWVLLRVSGNRWIWNV